MPNRYICAVLEEMREASKVKNFSYIDGLIEEIQSMANRMEAALGDKSDIKHYQEESSKLRKQNKIAREELKEVNHQIDDLKEEKKELDKEIKAFRHEFKKATKGGTIKPGPTTCCERNADNMGCDCKD